MISVGDEIYIHRKDGISVSHGTAWGRLIVSAAWDTGHAQFVDLGKRCTDGVVRCVASSVSFPLLADAAAIRANGQTHVEAINEKLLAESPELRKQVDRFRRSANRRFRSKDVPDSNANDIAAGASGDAAKAGHVVIVDLMNVLVTAWHSPQQKSNVHAVRTMLGTVRRVIETLSPDVLLFAAEGGHDFRRNLYPAYKANRDDTPPELQAQIQRAHEVLQAIGWPVLSSPGYEADDVIATVAGQCQTMALDCTIVSSDKDLRALAGVAKIYDPFRKQMIGPKEVEERFGVGPGQLLDLLALAGDRSDNVPGVPGIGEKTAATLLEEHGSLEGVLTASVFRKSNVSKRWSAIYQHRDTALLSRKLVELHSSIPIPTGWETWSALHPRSLWVDRLRQMGLGMTVNGLSDVLKDPRTTETPLRQPTIKGEQHGGDNLSRRPEAAGGNRDLAGEPEGHNGDSRLLVRGTDPVQGGVPDAGDPGCDRPELRERVEPGASVSDGREGSPPDHDIQAGWVGDCRRAGFELTTDAAHPVTGNWHAMRDGRKYILHASCEQITAIATGDSFTLKTFTEQVHAA